jgi:hypothetical protein
VILARVAEKNIRHNRNFSLLAHLQEQADFILLFRRRQAQEDFKVRNPLYWRGIDENAWQCRGIAHEKRRRAGFAGPLLHQQTPRGSLDERDAAIAESSRWVAVSAARPKAVLWPVSTGTRRFGYALPHDATKVSGKTFLIKL